MHTAALLVFDAAVTDGISLLECRVVSRPSRKHARKASHEGGPSELADVHMLRGVASAGAHWFWRICEGRHLGGRSPSPSHPVGRVDMLIMIVNITSRDPWCSPSVRCAAQDVYPAWHAVMLAGEMHMTVSFMLS